MFPKAVKIIRHFYNTPTIKPKLASKLNESLNPEPFSGKSPSFIKLSQTLTNVDGINQIKKHLPNKHKSQLKKKTPVVTVMGHVDHGKTTLLDYLRQTNIAKNEFGGITQSIGAFHIICQQQQITFIDTPGHEAFKNMRRRGAQVTDLIILVVSAIEGMKKQTDEVINIIKMNQIPVIVAINKIDLPEADPQAVEKQLNQKLHLQPYGGQVPVIHISAINGHNIDLLTELIVEETQHLKAEFAGLAEATVLEAEQVDGKLNSMAVIVNKGRIRVGSILMIGSKWMKVKIMKNDKNKFVSCVQPGEAVKIMGIGSLPNAGELINEVENENKAKQMTRNERRHANEGIKNNETNVENDKRAKIKFADWKEKKTFVKGIGDVKMRKFQETKELLETKIEQLGKMQNSQMAERLKAEKEQQLEKLTLYIKEYIMEMNQQNVMNVIIKSSERGIEQTLVDEIDRLKDKIQSLYQLKLNVVDMGIGEINQNDLINAEMYNAPIFTFGVGMSNLAVSDQDSNPHSHQLIHTLLKDIEDKAILRKQIIVKTNIRGVSVLLDVFKLKRGKGEFVAVGLRVSNGKISLSHKLFVYKNGVPISQALIPKTIKVFKKEVSEVVTGQECTLEFEETPNELLQKGYQLCSVDQ